MIKNLVCPSGCNRSAPHRLHHDAEIHPARGASPCRVAKRPGL